MIEKLSSDTLLLWLMVHPLVSWLLKRKRDTVHKHVSWNKQRYVVEGGKSVLPVTEKKRHSHGWEIAVILRNFRKTKLSKSIYFILFFFFILYFNMYNMRLDDFCFAAYANIAFRHFTALPPAKPPSSFGTRMIQTWSSFSRAWNSSRKRGFSPKWKSKIAEKKFFRGKTNWQAYFFFFKQSIGVAESCQQNRALMELSFADICIF